MNLKIQTIFTGVFISLAGGITGAVKQTGNKLEIEVVNLWPNRLIGDEQLPDDGIQNGHLNWRPSSGDWKILFFMCRNDEGIVDYLDPDAVTKFTEMTHDEYYKHFGDYFGSTIVGTFFDEPTMYRAQGRCWTPSFNSKFQEKYGFSPALYYPALWYDIGEETQEARNYLFGFRSELYHDFMFLHPEVLDEQCIIKENKLFLDNKVQHNAFSAIIVPGCRTISLSNLNKIKAFADAGGSVIFTTTLPEKATLLADNEKVKTIVNNLIREKKAVLIEDPSAENLGRVVDKLPAVNSVRFTGQERVNNMHKILNGKDVWYFANPGMKNKTVDIELNGIHKLEAWDPHTGETGKKINFTYKNGNTLFSLNLENGKSLFILADI